jgi:L-gulonolactone oxidase
MAKTAAGAAARWVNWGRNQRCAPTRVEEPTSLLELAGVVRRAAAEGLPVKAVGSGHSFTDIACTHGVHVRLGRYDQVLSVDRAAGRVVVQAGATVAGLNERLAGEGLALPNLGDVGYQTVSGAVATATHGTGARRQGIASQVVGLELVAGDGTVVRCSDREEPDVWAAARVGLGAAGLVSTLTLQCVPAFNLHAVEEAMPVDRVLASLDELVDGNDHFEFFWVPHTEWALTKRNNRTQDNPRGPGRARTVYERVILENVAFGAVCRLGRARPSLIPRLAAAVPSSGTREFIDRSHRVFTSPRLVRFCEMEYAVPRRHAATALGAVRDLVERTGLLVSFPVEVRFLGEDDIPLSMAQGRDSCFVAVHMYAGTPYDQYFRAVEEIMMGLEGRPHWGKLHYRTAATLAPAYPMWDRFQEVRRRLDPDGRFANDYTDRVLGPVQTGPVQTGPVQTSGQG